MAAEEQQFYQLLENLMSLDNTIRQQAEVCGAHIYLFFLLFYRLSLKNVES